MFGELQHDRDSFLPRHAPGVGEQTRVLVREEVVDRRSGRHPDGGPDLSAVIARVRRSERDGIEADVDAATLQC